MNKILELRQKRAKVWKEATDFLDSKSTTDGYLSAEDTATYEKMETDVVNLGKEIDILERKANIDSEMAAAVNNPITERPTSSKQDNKSGRASSEYKDSFWNAMRVSSIPAPVRNALQIGTDSEGGYLVPDEFENTLVEALQEENIFRSLATTVTTENGDRKIPLVSSKGEASWVDEEGLITDSDDSFGQMSLGAHKLATMIKVSEELLNDSAFDLPGYLAKEFARRIGAKEEDAFFVGNGTSKPTGILNATGGGEVGVTASAVAALTADEIIDLYYSLKKPYRKRAVFVMNDSTVKAIRKLKDGNGQYLWQPSIQAGAPNTILDSPLITSASMPTIASAAKTIAFGDMTYYWIADRQSRTFRRLNELYAANGQIGFIATQRVDGKLTLAEAVKVLQQKA